MSFFIYHPMGKFILFSILLGIVYYIIIQYPKGREFIKSWPFQIVRLSFNGFLGMNLFVILICGISWWYDYIAIPFFNISPNYIVKVYKKGIEDAVAEVIVDF